MCLKHTKMCIENRSLSIISFKHTIQNLSSYCISILSILISIWNVNCISYIETISTQCCWNLCIQNVLIIPMKWYDHKLFEFASSNFNVSYGTIVWHFMLFASHGSLLHTYNCWNQKTWGIMRNHFGSKKKKVWSYFKKKKKT